MSIGLTFEGVVFDYPDGTRALDGADLAIAPGDSVALVGQNGSGKSTLVRHLVGLLRPSQGRVLVGGDDAAGLRVAQLAERVGLVFQDPDRQIFAGSVRDEVAFGPRNRGLRGQKLDEAVREALETVGLGGQEQTNPYDLGPSRRRLLAIASVLAMQTPAVVLDEPTTGQDARGMACVQAIVRELVEQGRTVVAVSHDMRFVAETFARVAVMRAGRVILEGPPVQVFAESSWPALASTFLDPPEAAHAGARLGLGSTPTERSVVDALGARARGHPEGGAAVTIAQP